MRRLVLATVLVVVVPLLGACGVAGCEDPEPVVPTGGAGTASAMSSGERLWAVRLFELVNEARVGHGLEAYTWDENAAEAAYAHAYDMDARDYFAHLDPDGVGTGTRLRDHGVSLVSCSENLARDYTTPEAVLAGWMGSPAHRATVLDPLYTSTGIGIHTSHDGGPWWVQDVFR